MQRNYERHLPHYLPEGFPIFVTWCLKGALPRPIIEMLRRERARLERQNCLPGESPEMRKVRHGKILFAIAVKHLDLAADGPAHLKDPAVAKTVEESILFGVPERYDLYAWCVMANHVHVLFQPRWKFEKIMQGIKGFTAHEINAQQNASGRIFWQDESYDHWVRDDEELNRIIDYIEQNPVRAGLCQSPADWRWSSARHRSNWLVGQAFQPDTHLRPIAE